MEHLPEEAQQLIKQLQEQMETDRARLETETSKTEELLG